jgi:hypothetical protein
MWTTSRNLEWPFQPLNANVDLGMWVSKDAPPGENTNLSSLVLYQLPDTAQAASYLVKNIGTAPNGFKAFTKYMEKPSNTTDYEGNNVRVNFSWFGKPVLPNSTVPKTFWLAWLAIAYRRVTLAIEDNQPHAQLMASIRASLYSALDPVPALARRATVMASVEEAKVELENTKRELEENVASWDAAIAQLNDESAVLDKDAKKEAQRVQKLKQKTVERIAKLETKLLVSSGNLEAVDNELDTLGVDLKTNGPKLDPPQNEGFSLDWQKFDPYNKVVYGRTKLTFQDPKKLRQMTCRSFADNPEEEEAANRTFQNLDQSYYAQSPYPELKREPLSSSAPSEGGGNDEPAASTPGTVQPGDAEPEPSPPGAPSKAPGKVRLPDYGKADREREEQRRAARPGVSKLTPKLKKELEEQQQRDRERQAERSAAKRTNAVGHHFTLTKRLWAEQQPEGIRAIVEAQSLDLGIQSTGVVQTAAATVSDPRTRASAKRLNETLILKYYDRAKQQALDLAYSPGGSVIEPPVDGVTSMISVMAALAREGLLI